RDFHVTGVQTCALPICQREASAHERALLFEEIRKWQWQAVASIVKSLLYEPYTGIGGELLQPMKARQEVPSVSVALVRNESVLRIGRASCRGKGEALGG